MADTLHTCVNQVSKLSKTDEHLEHSPDILF